MIRVKTAPEMDLIARSEDLNSPEVLEKLKIEGIEKFNPDNPDLPENVRARLDELAAEGKTIGAFYDKKTNKIFVNENLEDDAEIRASIAREWKIAEDLNAQKGKANEAGQLKSTVAGELAYDDILKRSREGKTGSISTDELKDAVMDADSEVTSDIFYSTGTGFRDEKGRPVTSYSTAHYPERMFYSTGTGFRDADESPKRSGKKQTDDKKKAETKKRNDEKQRIKKELASDNCNGKCVKTQQKVYEDYITDAGKLLSCRSGNSKDCNPNTTSELIIFKTDKELAEYSDKLKGLGIREDYRLDSQERIDRNYNNSSDRQKQAIDYENVLNIQRNTGKNVETLYNEGKITERQYSNYRKEKGYIDRVNSYSSIINNSAKPITNAVFLGILSSTARSNKNSSIRNDLRDKDIEIHEGKQGKHVIGHNNYQKGKSELDMETSKNILNEYKGTGEIIINSNIQIKEIVDTKGKYTGIFVDQKTGIRYKTSRFTIHYDAKGTAHIVPAKPIINLMVFEINSNPKKLTPNTTETKNKKENNDSKKSKKLED